VTKSSFWDFCQNQHIYFPLEGDNPTRLRLGGYRLLGENKSDIDHLGISMLYMHEGQRISYVNVWPITKCNRNKEGPIINVHSQLHLLTGYARERLCGNFGIRFFDRKKCVLQGISDSHTRPRGLPFNGLYILLYRVKYKAGKSLFCVRLEAEIQLESGLDLNRESTALAVLHICSDQQKYTWKQDHILF